MLGRNRALLIVILLGVAVLALFAWSQVVQAGTWSGFPLDDSYIHLEFARNLAAGEGLAFDPGRTVPGSTAPLWTALLVPGFLLGSGGALAWAKLLGALLFLWAALETAGLCRDLGAGGFAAGLAGVLFVLTETLAFSALSGMEVPLFLALTLRGVRCFVREERLAAESGGADLFAPSTWILAVSALARPEGLLLLALALGERLLRHPEVRSPRSLGRALGLAALLLLPTGLFFLALHGSPFPTTFSVKAGGGHRWLPATRDLWRYGEVLFRVQPWMTFLAAAGALRLVRSRQPLLPAIWLLALPFAYSAMAPPGGRILLGNFGRYAFPGLPFVIVLGVLAVDELASALGPPSSGGDGRRGLLRRMTVALAVLTLLAPSVLATLQGAARSGLAVRNVQQSDVAAARWIATNLPEATIAAQDIGALGFYTDNAVVDLVGLVNPEILPYLRGEEVGRHPSGLEGILGFARRAGADHLLLFPDSYGGMANLRSIEPGLRVLRRFPVERNVAMAADELVLFVLPPR